MIYKKTLKYRHYVKSRLFEYKTLKNLRKEGVVAQAIVKAFLKSRYKSHSAEVNQVLIELGKFRDKLARDKRIVSFEEIGSSQSLTVAEVSHRAASPEVWTSFFYELSQDKQISNVLEIGTNLGVSGQYFLKALEGKKNARFTTIEGVKKLCEIAIERFKSISKPKQFEVRHGLYDQKLLEIVETKKKYDLVFIDGNHQYDATLKYFRMLKNNLAKNVIVIFDDIYWSYGMKRAWKRIVQQEGIALSIDFFKLGIIVFNPNKSAKSVEQFQLFLPS